MSKIRKFFYLILIVNILYSSCKNDNKLNSKTYINTNKLISSEQNKKQADKEKILYLELPDSIKAPTLINGKIHYNTQLTPFENKVTSSRYLFLHINFDQNPKDYDLESLKNNPRSLMFEDTTLTGIFQFKYLVENPNAKNFHGIIEDIRILKNEKPKDSVKITTTTTMITKNLTIE